ncbi:porin [Roseinatronobacter sp.]|uniref:porin n=1 Tax=Roseinatronobacter sp. TaxID=1945755 RepID=UPI0025D16284|nr:porin [Roseibaca sp.]
MLARAVILALLIVVPAQAQTTREPTGLSLQGQTRMGVVWDRPAATPGSDRAEARLYARTQLKLRFVGETDGGVQFGAELDLDKLGSDNPNRPRGQRVFLGN